MAIKKFKNIKNAQAQAQNDTKRGTNPKQFIQLTSLCCFCCVHDGIFVAVFIRLCQCLSCLIIKCMLLTFIFNYFSRRG